MIQMKLIQKLPELEVKAPILLDFRAGDVRHSQANVDKAKRLLGYNPDYFISDGLDQAMDWYIKFLKT